MARRTVDAVRAAHAPFPALAIDRHLDAARKQLGRASIAGRHRRATAGTP
ncbi:MAG: hypothetical protein ACRYF2_24470 [Janthinobacterium lividum]